MRTRPIIALSAAALAVLALAGCSSQAAPSASPTTTAAADLCTAKVAAGTASDAVKVTGDVGKEAKAEFDKPLEVKTLESSIVTEGTGAKLRAGDLVKFALTEFNAKTGAKNGAIGQGESSLLPQQISANSILGQVLGCAGVGTRVVAAIPGDQTNPASVDIVDVLDIVPNAAWGTAVAPQDGFPAVKLASDGTPSVTLPKTDMPTAFKKETLKRGDGEKVAAGDAVLVQYSGVSWNSGKTFDKSWGGQPFSFQVGQGVVKGFSDAVTGETVGSQVLAVLPPSVAYGEGKINEKDLKGQTLVFVVDILGVQHNTAQ
ncbi:FKBP-type peptidyl-prolyl cis-trans isomerase [Microbacterium sp. SYP-A9085]|uniref:FKBP-type peptidyl-prolyl cis-trans isomerase n=1 Tax=Microbacterium sp. SYP-A9085 TaxID=2664454 RepID=UPI00132367DC|nr:FKBP-type peptidyl-prolyl cis-trans isomerase [Microbacterium sp. SYP-A9085]